MRHDEGKEIEVFLCTQSATWPLEVFESEEHAMRWYRGPHDGGVRIVQRAKIIVGEELELSEPKPKFVPKEKDSVATNPD